MGITTRLLDKESKKQKQTQIRLGKLERELLNTVSTTDTHLDHWYSTRAASLQKTASQCVFFIIDCGSLVGFATKIRYDNQCQQRKYQFERHFRRLKEALIFVQS